MTGTKIDSLKQILCGMKSMLVAYSGGIDSSLLLKIALDTLGPENVLAITAYSATYPAEEWETAKKLAQTIGARHLNILTQELQNDNFTQNPPERCYHCKLELFGKLREIAHSKGLSFVVDGANADDLNDFRPGMKACKELGVRSPLQEAGLTKAEIRETARILNLPNWDKPSMPCLSSRIPYGQTITPAKLHQVEEAERFLRSLDIPELRVRHHGTLARVEVPESLIEKLASSSLRQNIVDKLTALGFNYVTLDLKGLRTGSMNEVLSKEVRHG